MRQALRPLLVTLAVLVVAEAIAGGAPSRATARAVRGLRARARKLQQEVQQWRDLLADPRREFLPSVPRPIGVTPQELADRMLQQVLDDPDAANLTVDEILQRVEQLTAQALEFSRAYKERIQTRYVPSLRDRLQRVRALIRRKAKAR